jgi:hypothetical protein
LTIDEHTEVLPIMTIGAVARAESLRLAGRWEEALAALDGMDTAEAWLERVQVLSDEHLLPRLHRPLARLPGSARDADPARGPPRR